MSVRDIFQLSMENHEESVVDDDSVEHPLFEGFEPERSVIFHGNIQSGEWEQILQDSYKEFRVWNLPGRGVEIPSLETIQLQEHAAELTEALLREATQVYVLPEEDLGQAVQEEFLNAAMNNPENSVVVTKRPEALAVDALRQKGIAVVTSLEDAALYVATAC